MEITKEVLIKTLETLCSEEDLQPYKDLGNSLYKLPNGAITNQKGLDEYLEELRKIGEINYGTIYKQK